MRGDDAAITDPTKKRRSPAATATKTNYSAGSISER